MRHVNWPSLTHTTREKPLPMGASVGTENMRGSAGSVCYKDCHYMALRFSTNPGAVWGKQEPGISFLLPGASAGAKRGHTATSVLSKLRPIRRWHPPLKKRLYSGSADLGRSAPPQARQACPRRRHGGQALTCLPVTHTGTNRCGGGTGAGRERGWRLRLAKKPMLSTTRSADRGED